MHNKLFCIDHTKHALCTENYKINTNNDEKKVSLILWLMELNKEPKGIQVKQRTHILHLLSWENFHTNESEYVYISMCPWMGPYVLLQRVPYDWLQPEPSLAPRLHPIFQCSTQVGVAW